MPIYLQKRTYSVERSDDLYLSSPRISYSTITD